MQTRPNVNYSQVQKGGIPINRETHACQRSRNIPILHLRPKVFQRCLPKEYLAFKRVQNSSFLKKALQVAKSIDICTHPVPFNKIQESIMCLWFFPNAYFGLLYHTLSYTPSGACFVGVGESILSWFMVQKPSCLFCIQEESKTIIGSKILAWRAPHI